LGRHLRGCGSRVEIEDGSPKGGAELSLVGILMIAHSKRKTNESVEKDLGLYLRGEIQIITKKTNHKKTQDQPTVVVKCAQGACLNVALNQKKGLNHRTITYTDKYQKRVNQSN